MRKILIAALILAAGCDATRRDFNYCSQTYTECGKGFSCNQTTGRCEPDSDGGLDAPDAPWTNGEAQPPSDVPAGEVTLDVLGEKPLGIDGLVVDGPTSDAPADAPIRVDGDRGDGGEPDGPNTCSGRDSDCKDPLLPICVSYQCVACKVSTDCTNPARPFCSAQNTCVSCALAGPAFCSGKTPVCDSSSGRCVECVDNGACTKDPAKAFCAGNTCQGCNAPGASASNGGGADGGIASDGGGIDASVAPACVGAKPMCASTGAMAGQCVQCLDNSSCSGTKPICTNFACAPCTSDSQCTSGPGVCMSHQDSRCASDTETIYVKNTTSCSGGSGTANSPYCDTQAAMNAVTSSRRVIVAKGPATDVLLPISSTPTGGPVSLIGLNGATTSSGAAIGIHVTAGELYVRGLTIANGSSKPGVVVEAGATLRMDRCIVKSNAGGGLKVQAGASFDIANSVFHDNGAATGSDVTPFGGILLGGSAPSSGPHRVWFTTIISNQQRGVVCVDNTQALTGMLVFDNVGGGWANCTLNSTNSKWDSPGTGSDVSDPKFDSSKPYHLTSGSRCKDYIDATLDHPLYDLDGDPRPYPTNGKLDCGADEYHP